MKYFLQQAEISKYTNLIEILNEISIAPTEAEVLDVVFKKLKWVIGVKDIYLFKNNLTKKKISLIRSQKTTRNTQQELQNSILLKTIFSKEQIKNSFPKDELKEIANKNQFDKNIIGPEVSEIFTSLFFTQQETNYYILFSTDQKEGFSKNEKIQLNILSNIISSSFNRIESLVTLQSKNDELNKSLNTIKEMQETIIARERLASVGLLASGMAHELKNPLNLIKNSSQIIEDIFTEVDKTNREDIDSFLTGLKNLKISMGQFVEIIKVNSDRASGIIQTLLNQTRTENVEITHNSLNNIIEEALSLSYNSLNNLIENSKSKRVNISPKITRSFSQDFKIDCCKPELLSSFINLFDNSFYTTIKKGQLIADDNYIPKIDLSLSRKKNQIIFSLRDNGLGIAKNHLSDIFIPFYTTKPTGDGTGLGLSQVQDIMKKHNAEIEVESIEGEFTEFRLTFLSSNKG